MSSNLSVGSVVGSGIDRTPPYIDNMVMTAQNEMGGGQQAAPTAQIQSEDQLKKAELEGQRVPVSEKLLIEAIDRAIKAVQGPPTSLEFAIHKETNQIMVKVLNSETGQVIREVPPEKTLDFVARLMEKAGLIVDERR